MGEAACRGASEGPVEIGRGRRGKRRDRREAPRRRARLAGRRRRRRGGHAARRRVRRRARGRQRLRGRGRPGDGRGPGRPRRGGGPDPHGPGALEDDAPREPARRARTRRSSASRRPCPSSPGALKRVAIEAHDGIARAVRPAHTVVDGDVVFALAPGGPPRRLSCACGSAPPRRKRRRERSSPRSAPDDRRAAGRPPDRGGGAPLVDGRNRHQGDRRAAPEGRLLPVGVRRGRAARFSAARLSLGRPPLPSRSSATRRA